MYLCRRYIPQKRGNDTIILGECLRQMEMRERREKPRSRWKMQRKYLYKGERIAIQEVEEEEKGKSRKRRCN